MRNLPILEINVQMSLQPSDRICSAEYRLVVSTDLNDYDTENAVITSQFNFMAVL